VSLPIKLTLIGGLILLAVSSAFFLFLWLFVPKVGENQALAFTLLMLFHFVFIVYFVFLIKDTLLHASVRVDEHGISRELFSGKVVDVPWSDVTEIRKMRIREFYLYTIGDTFIVEHAGGRLILRNVFLRESDLEERLHHFAPPHVKLRLAFSERVP